MVVVAVPRLLDAVLEAEPATFAAEEPDAFAADDAWTDAPTDWEASTAAEETGVAEAVAPCVLVCADVELTETREATPVVSIKTPFVQVYFPAS